ncbi:hypothetical protein ACFU9X_09630 [Streptomyces atratus]|uniref:hypothetical protein n=1 Tax=Streptomyces atratus TaxID=1893 RepID=UPI0036993EAB
MTTRLSVGLFTPVNLASAKTSRLPTWSSPQLISIPGFVITGYASGARAPRSRVKPTVARASA